MDGRSVASLGGHDVRQTRSVVNHHLVPHLGDILVTDLTTARIDALYGHLLRCGGQEGRSLAPGTVHRVHVVLHRALAQAQRWEWIWTNPASTASPPRQEPAEIRPPTPDQVMALLDFVQDKERDLFTYLRLAVSTGARRSQILALRWSDIDLARASISFTRALVDGPNGPVLRPTKTHRTYRVALDTDTAASSPPTETAAPSGGTDSCSAPTAASTRGSRTTSPSGSSPPDRPPASTISDSTTSATSWPPRCSPPASPSPRSPNA